jgi:hypothetical protein
MSEKYKSWSADQLISQSAGQVVSLSAGQPLRWSGRKQVSMLVKRDAELLTG